jgi:hypothetical protein
LSVFLLGACGPTVIVSGTADESATSSDSGDPGPGDPHPDDPDPPEEEDDEDDNEGIFVPTGDTADVQHCDSFLQDCSAGEKCVPYAAHGGTWDSHKCVPVLGSDAIWEPCKGTNATLAHDTCDRRGACWDLDKDQNGTCSPMCTGTGDNPVCPEGASCLIGTGSLAICVRECDPLLQDCEGNGVGCYWGIDKFQCIFTGDADGGIPSGEPCGFINDCAPGDVCMGAESVSGCEGDSCCTTWCHVDEPQCDDPEHECVPWYEEGQAPPGQEHIGVCVLP